MKIDECIDKYLLYISSERRLSPLTVEKYGQILHIFAEYASELQIEYVKDIHVNDIRNWQISLMEEGKSPRTTAAYIVALRSWFKYMKQRGYSKSNIMEAIAAPKTPKTMPVIFKESEVEKIYNEDIFPKSFEGERDKLILRLLYETGMRRAELAGLTDQSVDLSAKTIRVFGKRKKERLIPIESELANNIKRYFSLKKEIDVEGNALFTDRKGKPITGGMIYYIVKKYMRVLSVSEKTSPHVFRHTFATGMLNEGANIDAIKELLGHGSLTATEIYTHVTREHLKEAYRHSHPRARKQRTKPAGPAK